MTEGTYLTYSEVEKEFRRARNKIIELVNAGLLVAHGEGRGKLITVASVRRLQAMIAEDVDIWQLAKAKDTAKARSGRTKKAEPTTSRPLSTDSDRDESGVLTPDTPKRLRRNG
jgi:hypothetical protein